MDRPCFKSPPRNGVGLHKGTGGPDLHVSIKGTNGRTAGDLAQIFLSAECDEIAIR